MHFLLIGLFLFLIHGRVSPGDSGSRRIVVGEAQVKDMVRQYQSTFNRPPTRPELDSLIENWVRSEILYREGLALGLDQDDAVIKRRILQKYELIAEEEGRVEPTDADLAAYVKAHPAAFLPPAVVSFDQIFFDPATTSPQAVDAVKARLVTGGNHLLFGQPSMLPRRVERGSIELVARDFGDNFAKRVESATPGVWIGPLASGIGVHLVRVNARAVPALPPLEQIRAAVAREWESDQRSRSSEASYRKARADYEVVHRAKLP